jgi:hypothetical protein
MFEEIASIADQKTRIDKYKELQATFVRNGQVAELQQLIDHSRRSRARARAGLPFWLCGLPTAPAPARLLALCRHRARARVQ